MSTIPYVGCTTTTERVWSHKNFTVVGHDPCSDLLDTPKSGPGYKLYRTKYDRNQQIWAITPEDLDDMIDLLLAVRSKGMK